jgi:hypothetical protein
MMRKIRFGGMTKEGADDPGDPMLQEACIFFKELTMTDAMQHQTKASFKVEL